MEEASGAVASMEAAVFMEEAGGDELASHRRSS